MGAEQSLTEAVADGDEVAVAEMLSNEQKARSLVRERDHHGTTPLHVAAEEGYADICALLLDAGAEPLVGDDIGFTPLHRAVQHGHAEVAKLLIDYERPDCPPDQLVIQRQKRVNAANHFGVRPLHWACTWNQDTCCRILIENGAVMNCKQTNNGHTPLHVAAMHSSVESLKIMLALLPNASRRLQLLHITDKEGKTPLDVCQDAAVLAILEEYQSDATSSRRRSTDRRSTERRRSGSGDAQRSVEMRVL